MYKTQSNSNQDIPKKPKKFSKYHTVIVIFLILGMAALYVFLWSLQFTKIRQETLSKYLDQTKEIKASQIAEAARQTIEDQNKPEPVEELEELDENQMEVIDAMEEFLKSALLTNNFTLSVQDDDKFYIYMTESKSHFLLQINDNIYIVDDDQVLYKHHDEIRPLQEDDELLYVGYTELEDIIKIIEDCAMHVENVNEPFVVKYQNLTYTCTVNLKNTPSQMLTFDIISEDNDIHAVITNIGTTHVAPAITE